ncbi:MAG: hypothetical protein PHG03_04630 [Bacilli bacterium]|nr:hypothetical protein [Bacilli bacterium]
MNKITKHQYNSTLFLLARPLFLGFGIYKIINIVGSYYYISIILGIFLGLLLNQIIKKINNINFIKLLISIILLIYGTYSLTNSISTLYLNQTPKIIILAALLLIIIYSRSKNKENIFKVANILFIINIGLFLITTFSLIPYINIEIITLANNFNLANILISSIYFALLSTIPYLILPNFKENYNYKAYILSSLYTLILFTLIITILGAPVASIYKYPEYIIFKKISILNIIENVQNILFMSWIFESFIMLGIASNNINKKILLLILIVIFITYSIFITKINILF